MKKYFILLIIFNSFFFAQDMHLQKDYAEKLYQSEQFFDAITEYKRLQFFDKDKKYATEIDHKIGLCYKAGGWLDESSRYLNRALYSSTGRSQKFTIAIDVIKVNLLRKTCAEAREVIDNLESEYVSGDTLDILRYWRGWSYMFEDRWKDAGNQFKEINPGHELAELCFRVEERKLSVTFAKLISYILPGSGQIYAGEYLSGIMSLAWNILCGYWTINAVVSERVFDAVVIGNLLWFRFYKGNYENAEKFAVDKNLRIANEVLDYLQNNYKGLKP